HATRTRGDSLRFESIRCGATLGVSFSVQSWTRVCYGRACCEYASVSSCSCCPIVHDHHIFLMSSIGPASSSCFECATGICIHSHDSSGAACDGPTGGGTESHRILIAS